MTEPRRLYRSLNASFAVLLVAIGINAYLALTDWPLWWISAIVAALAIAFAVNNRAMYFYAKEHFDEHK